MAHLACDFPRPDIWLDPYRVLAKNAKSQITAIPDFINGNAFETVSSDVHYPLYRYGLGIAGMPIACSGASHIYGRSPVTFYSNSSPMNAIACEFAGAADTTVWQVRWDSDNYWRLATKADGTLSWYVGSSEINLKSFHYPGQRAVVTCYIKGGYYYLTANGLTKKGGNSYYLSPGGNTAAFYLGGVYGTASFAGNIGTVMAWNTTSGLIQPLVERYLLAHYRIPTVYPVYPRVGGSGIVASGAGTDLVNGSYAPDGRTCNGYPVYVGPTGDVTLWGYTYTTTLYLAVVGFMDFYYWSICDYLNIDYGYAMDEFYDHYAAPDGDLPPKTGWSIAMGDSPAPTLSY